MNDNFPPLDLTNVTVLAHRLAPIGEPDAEFDFIDLFAGMGGMRIPFDELGGRCVFSSEWDRYAQESYAANFNEKPSGDITKIDPADIPGHDILLAGYPCQSFSILGARRGFDDTRGTLFFNVATILEAKQPAGFLLENVKGLKSHDHGRTFDVILNTLQGLGYHVHTEVLNALDYGHCQRRERTIMVGFKDDVQFSFPPAQGPPPHLNTILELEAANDPGLRASGRIIEKRKQQLAKQGVAPFSPSVWHENKSRHVSVLPYSVALRANASHNYVLVDGERRFSSRELLRLQGFPESYKVAVSHAQVRRQTGNSVPINMIRAVAVEMRAAMELSERLRGAA